MNENINLCEILKGHEGKAFYNPLVGEIEFKESKDGLVFFKYGYSLISLPYTGLNLDGNLDIFPSKNQRDWNKWDKENNNKIPKTWSELKEKLNNFCLGCTASKNEMADGTEKGTPIEKSALALLKIHQLIEVGYGGNVSKDEFFDEHIMKYIINLEKEEGRFHIYQGINMMNTHIAFHTKEQAKEFLSYPENIQLLRDYFQIN